MRNNSKLAQRIPSLDSMDESLQRILVGFTAEIENLMKIPIVDELVSWVAERRTHIKWFLLSSIVDFLHWARLKHLDVNLHIKLTVIVIITSASTIRLLNYQMHRFHVAKFELSQISSLRFL
jgi:hypothetical protein